MNSFPRAIVFSRRSLCARLVAEFGHENVMVRDQVLVWPVRQASKAGQGHSQKSVLEGRNVRTSGRCGRSNFPFEDTTFRTRGDKGVAARGGLDHSRRVARGDPTHDSVQPHLHGPAGGGNWSSRNFR